MNNTKSIVPLINGELPSGPAYMDISEFDIFNPFADIPYFNNMIGAYFLSSQMLNPLNNYADLGNPLLKYGSPEINSKYASVSDGNYFDTKIKVAGADATIIEVAKNPSTTVDAWSISNYTGNNAIGSDSILLRKDRKMEVYTSAGTGLSSTVIDMTGAGAPDDLAIVAGRFGPDDITGSVFLPETGGLLQGTRAAARATNANRNYCFGVRPGLTGNGNSHVSIGLIFRERLSDETLLSIMQYLRNPFGARYGLW
ncbi:hypothetical protein [Serratia marcescens]|uniref:hypothetical protein n=1 Tax=Serratia marcescens TaxID=615 RepID=UPI003204A861